MFSRIALFLATNFAVLVLAGIILLIRANSQGHRHAGG